MSLRKRLEDFGISFVASAAFAVALWFWDRLLPDSWPGANDLMPYILGFVAAFVGLTAWKVQGAAGGVPPVNAVASRLPTAEIDALNEFRAWDSNVRRDWWMSSRIRVDIGSVHLAGLSNESAPKIQVNVRFLNMLTDSVKITNLVGDSGVAVDWEEPNEAGAILTRHFETGEALRFNPVIIWRSSESSVPLLLPVSHEMRNALLRVRGRRGMFASYTLKGTWVAEAFGEERNLIPGAISIHCPIRD